MSEKFGYAIRFKGDEIYRKDVIGKYITNDPEKIRRVFRNLVDNLYPFWAKDTWKIDNQYDADCFGDTFDFEGERLPPEMIPQFVKEKLESSIDIIKVYLDDVGLSLSSSLTDSDVFGNLPLKVYFVHGSSRNVWTVITDSEKKAKDYIRKVFDEDGDGDDRKVTLDKEPTKKKFFTYSGY